MAQVNLAENDDDSTSTLTFAEFCECLGMMALTAFENIRRIQSRRYGKISPQVRASARALMRAVYAAVNGRRYAPHGVHDTPVRYTVRQDTCDHRT